ncbi:SH3 domain-containing YSC84-like protein 1 [Asterias amurensis]|uniref:SH3 domain-containing YSC84-like protein 1 n=1 Tax=Asterias amurensis TaxID=7602 RepID=UPI003AB1FE43
MSSHEGKDRDKQKGSIVRRGFRSLSFRKPKKKTKSTANDCVDGRHSRHRHSASELTNNNNSSGSASMHSGVALLPFNAILPCDLTFKAGDRIDILTQTENCYDWWEGRLNGRTGIFPANYIKVLH